MKRYHKVFSISVLVGLLLLNSTSLGKPDTQFDFLSFIKSAYDAYNKIKNFLEPDPNLADLILEAKKEIIDEINQVWAEEEIANVEALIEQYTIYLNNPPSQQIIEAWIRDAINAANQFEIIIGNPNKSAHIAYLSAKSYNMLIPLMALMMQRHGIRTDDILPLLEDAIATNKALLGNFVWDDPPNAPIYWEGRIVVPKESYVGKLYECLVNGIIDSTEYETTYDIVWTANEECRQLTIVRYEEVWFFISNERSYTGITPEDNKYLCAHSRPGRTEASVLVSNLRANDTDFLWRLEFQTGHRFKIVHWSGKYLAATPDRKVIITPDPEGDNQIWYFDTRYSSTSYHDRGMIRAKDYYIMAGQNSAYLGEHIYGPDQNRDFIIHYATRKATGIGYSAFPCPADYDGDGKADLGMKINDGLWLLDLAANGFGSWDRQISSLPDIDKYARPAPADYDGDGKADISVKHDMTGNWYIDYAANGFGSWDFTRHIMGPNLFYRYHPVPADYDGDGKADLALFLNTGGWSLDYSANGFNGWDDYPHSWGNFYPANDIYPAPADYDGDGKADISIKQDNGRWHFDLAYNGFVWTNEWDLITAPAVNYGDITAHPVPGSYWWNSWYHQRADLAAWTESGRWIIDSYLGVAGTPIDWTSNAIYGSKNAYPVPADYDGDGMLDLSVIEANGTWLMDYSGNGYGSIDWSSALSFPTAISSPEPAVDRSCRGISYRLLSNYPNPFNGSTQIHYSVRQSDNITIKIYNLLGTEVATLVDEHKAVGEYTVTWDGRDRQGIELPSGIYLCKMHHRSMTQGLKMLLVK